MKNCAVVLPLAIILTIMMTVRLASSQPLTKQVKIRPFQEFPPPKSCNPDCCRRSMYGSAGCPQSQVGDCLNCKSAINGSTATCSCCPAGSVRCVNSLSQGTVYCCGSGTTCAENGFCAITNIPGTQPVSVTCRRDSNLTITVDNEIKELYLDGVLVPTTQLPNYNNWPVPDVVPLPGTVTVIAVKAYNWEKIYHAGILASDTYEAVLTNCKWKCVNSTLSPNWMMPTFSDIGWPPAVVSAVNGGGIWGPMAGISTNAYWIWTTKQQTTVQTVYCRLTIN